MPRKTDKQAGAASPGATDDKSAGTVKDSANQIWLAGLGAFAKAQQEGGKVFEALVQEGLSVQRKTQAAAQERFAQAASRVGGIAGELSSRAAAPWDRLETLFEERVARALDRLEVPSARDFEALAARIDTLQRSLEQLGAKAPAAKAAGRKRAPRKPA